MRLARFVAISFVVLWPGYPASRLSGVWSVNREKSDLGLSNAPETVAVRLEQTDGHVAIWRITSDSEGQHLTYRDYDLKHKVQPPEVVRSAPRRIVLRTEPMQGTRIDEKWRVTRAGELIVTRVVTTSGRTVRQRLVLELATTRL